MTGGGTFDAEILPALRPGAYTLERYLRAYDSMSDDRARLAAFIEFYNTRRPQPSLAKKTPDEFYFATLPTIPRQLERPRVPLIGERIRVQSPAASTCLGVVLSNIALDTEES